MTHDLLHADLLAAIYDAGERMEAALKTNDLPAFFDQFRQRTTLIDRFRTFEQSPDLGPAWYQVADRLAQQHQRLVSAMAAQQERLATMLMQAERFKQARQGYDAARTAQLNVLNQQLSG